MPNDDHRQKRFDYERELYEYTRTWLTESFSRQARLDARSNVLSGIIGVILGLALVLTGPLLEVRVVPVWLEYLTLGLYVGGLVCLVWALSAVLDSLLRRDIGKAPLPTHVANWLRSKEKEPDGISARKYYITVSRPLGEIVCRVMKLGEERGRAMSRSLTRLKVGLSLVIIAIALLMVEIHILSPSGVISVTKIEWKRGDPMLDERDQSQNSSPEDDGDAAPVKSGDDVPDDSVWDGDSSLEGMRITEGDDSKQKSIELDDHEHKSDGRK